MAYSMDLRVRVLATYDKTGSSAAAARHHDVSESWVRRLAQRRRETGSIAPRSSARRRSGRVYDAADEAATRALIADRPDATLAEVAAHVGKPAGAGTVHRTLARLDLPREKSPRTPDEAKPVRPSATGPTCKPSGRPGSTSSPA